jgi:hypothetical protein
MTLKTTLHITKSFFEISWIAYLAFDKFGDIKVNMARSLTFLIVICFR